MTNVLLKSCLALRANDADSFKGWLYEGLQELGKPVLTALVLNAMLLTQHGLEGQGRWYLGGLRKPDGDEISQKNPSLGGGDSQLNGDGVRQRSGFLISHQSNEQFSAVLFISAIGTSLIVALPASALTNTQKVATAYWKAACDIKHGQIPKSREESKPKNMRELV